MRAERILGTFRLHASAKYQFQEATETQTTATAPPQTTQRNLQQHFISDTLREEVDAIQPAPSTHHRFLSTQSFTYTWFQFPALIILNIS